MPFLCIVTEPSVIDKLATVGVGVGVGVGSMVGSTVGVIVGVSVGVIVGVSVGITVGVIVGAGVVHEHSNAKTIIQTMVVLIVNLNIGYLAKLVFQHFTIIQDSVQ